MAAPTICMDDAIPEIARCVSAHYQLSTCAALSQGAPLFSLARMSD